MPGGQHAALGAAALCAVASGLAAAPVAYACDLTREGKTLRLAFDIDPASFALPLDAGDPPRRKVSRVVLEGDSFEAEAVLTEDGTRGFWAPDRDLMLTVAPTGAARFSDSAGTDWRGECKEG